MAAQLVPATAAGAELDEGVAGRGVAADRDRQLHGVDPAQLALGRLEGRVLALVGGDRVVDPDLLGGVAADHREVALGDAPLGEEGREAAGGLRGAGEEHQARGRAVEPVHGVDPGAELIAEDLDDVATVVVLAGDRRSVDQQPRGLVDSDVVLVFVDDRQGLAAGLVSGLAHGRDPSAVGRGALRSLLRSPAVCLRLRPSIRARSARIAA